MGLFPALQFMLSSESYDILKSNSMDLHYKWVKILVT